MGRDVAPGLLIAVAVSVFYVASSAPPLGTPLQFFESAFRNQQQTPGKPFPFVVFKQNEPQGPIIRAIGMPSGYETLNRKLQDQGALESEVNDQMEREQEDERFANILEEPKEFVAENQPDTDAAPEEEMSETGSSNVGSAVSANTQASEENELEKMSRDEVQAAHSQHVTAEERSGPIKNADGTIKTEDKPKEDFEQTVTIVLRKTDDLPEGFGIPFPGNEVHHVRVIPIFRKSFSVPLPQTSSGSVLYQDSGSSPSFGSFLPKLLQSLMSPSTSPMQMPDPFQRDSLFSQTPMATPFIARQMFGSGFSEPFVAREHIMPQPMMKIMSQPIIRPIRSQFMEISVLTPGSDDSGKESFQTIQLQNQPQIIASKPGVLPDMFKSLIQGILPIFKEVSDGAGEASQKEQDVEIPAAKKTEAGDAR